MTRTSVVICLVFTILLSVHAEDPVKDFDDKRVTQHIRRIGESVPVLKNPDACITELAKLSGIAQEIADWQEYRDACYTAREDTQEYKQKCVSPNLAMLEGLTKTIRFRITMDRMRWICALRAPVRGRAMLGLTVDDLSDAVNNAAGPGVEDEPWSPID